MSALTDQVDQLFAQWDSPESPGAVLAVIQNGEIVYSRAYGMADLERHVPLTTDSVFDLGSTGKQFTAMLIALLAQQGKLALDDSIRQVLPELPDYADAITVRHLIHHTSGMRDYTTLMYLADKHFQNFYYEDEFIDLIARQQAANFAPGAEYLYSNTGYLLLGVIAKRVTGKSYPDLIREYILDPLGMTATNFNDDFTRIIPNRALAYSPAGENGFATDISFCGGYGDGALISTVGDLLKWDQNFYHNALGEGGQALIDQITTPAHLNDGTPIDYAFGLMVRDYKGLKLISHGGAWAGYRAEMLRFPQQHFSVICLANRADGNPSGLALQVADLYLADVYTTPASDLASASTTTTTQAAQQTTNLAASPAITGTFRSLNGGSLAEFSTADDKLMLDYMGYSFPLQAISPNHLQTVESPVDLDVLIETSDTIAISLHGMEAGTYRRIAVDNTPDDASDYVGSYHSAELRIDYRIVCDSDSHLTVKRGYAPAEALRRVAADLYVSGFMIFEFVRDEAGQVTGFDLFADRVVNVRFERTTPS